MKTEQAMDNLTAKADPLQAELERVRSALKKIVRRMYQMDIDSYDFTTMTCLQCGAHIRKDRHSLKKLTHDPDCGVGRLQDLIDEDKTDG